jgi:DNA-binding NarL/FixJ family response regulator
MSQKHILIADDSSAIRKTLRPFLEKEDNWIVVGEAKNGKEAVQKAQMLKPDLVILDFAMPLMNGLQTVLELKRISPSLPLILFTNFASLHLEEIALSSGVNAVVSKSEPGVLVHKIHDLFATEG